MRISIYPLRQEHLTPAIEAVTRTLEAHGLWPEVGATCTRIAGEADTMFAALSQAFTAAVATGHVVMALTVSNACAV